VASADLSADGDADGVAGLKLDAGEVEALKRLFRQAKPIAAKKGDGVERLGKKEFVAFLKARAKARKDSDPPKDKDLAAAFARADAEKKGGVDEAGWVRFGEMVKNGEVVGVALGLVLESAAAAAVEAEDRRLVSTLTESEVHALQQCFHEAGPTVAVKGHAPRLGKKAFVAFLKARAAQRGVAVPKDKDLSAVFDAADSVDCMKVGSLAEFDMVRLGALVRAGAYPSIEFKLLKHVEFADLSPSDKAKQLKALPPSAFLKDPKLTVLGENGVDIEDVHDQVV